MSLDTILAIGSVLKSSSENIKYFKYVSPCPVDNENNYPLCISVPVLDDYSLDWNSSKVTPEKERNKLYYLRFKTSERDSLMKYIFGDIYYATSAKVKKDGSIEFSEGGGYRLADPGHSNAAFRASSFNRGNNDFDDIIKRKNAYDSTLYKFRNTLKKDLHILESILANISAIEYFFNNPSSFNLVSFIQDEKLVREYAIKQLFQNTSKSILAKLGVTSNDGDLTKEEQEKLLKLNSGRIFIHFDFPHKGHWYKFDYDIDLINQKLISDFVEETEHGFILKKTLYKTLCSGDKKNDIQFPDFDLNARHKSKSFNKNTLQDLFYGIDFSGKGLLIPGTEVKIIILPRGSKLTEKDYIDFFERYDEEKAKNANGGSQTSEGEPLFDIFEEPNNNITTFDVIFSKKGGLTSPDVDLIEISGIEKSSIRRTKQRIEEIARNINERRRSYFSSKTNQATRVGISVSLKNILGSPQVDSKTGKVSFKTNPKFQSHILKILPQIYTDNYHSDDILLSAFIRNVEFSIRAGDPKLHYLKFDLEFLISIQNNQSNKYMDITNSKSYQLGFLLGRMAKNFAGEKSPIKSFEKNYVGNLSRRISTIDDFIKLKNDIEQKLIMHERTNYTYQTSCELAQKIKDFDGTYDREECAFGFLESYFMPISKKNQPEEKSNS
jgi:hypothetical protein